MECVRTFWQIRSGGRQSGWIVEAQGRDTVFAMTDPQLAEAEVRQGEGLWYPALRVKEIFRNLMVHGTYLKIGETVLGPYTAKRAVDMIRQESRRHNFLEVRQGLNVPWQSVAEFYKSQRLDFDSTAPPKVAESMPVATRESEVESDSKAEVLAATEDWVAEIRQGPEIRQGHVNRKAP